MVFPLRSDGDQGERAEQPRFLEVSSVIESVHWLACGNSGGFFDSLAGSTRGLFINFVYCKRRRFRSGVGGKSCFLTGLWRPIHVPGRQREPRGRQTQNLRFQISKFICIGLIARLESQHHVGRNWRCRFVINVRIQPHLTSFESVAVYSAFKRWFRRVGQIGINDQRSMCFVWGVAECRKVRLRS